MTLRHTALLLAICLAWGLHMVVIKATVDLIAPVTYVALRMICLSIVLSPLLRWHEGQMGRILIGGIAFGGLNYLFMFSGLKLTTASIGAVLMESYVVIATLFSVLFLGERVGWKRTAGIAGAFIGVLIIATAEGELTGSENLALGATFILIAATSEATGAIFVKKIEGVKALSLLAWFALVGCVLTASLAAIVERDHFSFIEEGNALPVLGALGYSVIVASLFGHTSYYYLLQRVPLSIVAPSGLLVTLVAVVFGVLLLGETLTARVILGAALVMSGVGVVLVRSNAPNRKQVIASAAAGAEERTAEGAGP